MKRKYSPDSPRVRLMGIQLDPATLSTKSTNNRSQRNTILPVSWKGWDQRILLAVTHLTNTSGIAMATYGGAPSTTGGVFNAVLNKTGNLLMILVMLIVGVWIWSSWRRVNTFSDHVNYRNARWLLIAACASWPFQMIRLVYNTTYAFDRIASLDPVMGSFATQFVLLFLLHLAVVLIAVAGGWLSQHVTDKKQISYDGVPLHNLYSEDQGRQTEK